MCVCVFRSYQNAEEVLFVMALCRTVIKDGGVAAEDVGVISFYKGQVTDLKDRFRRA